MSKEVKVTSQRAVVAAIQLPAVSDEELESSLNELRELAKTLGFEVVATFTQKRANLDSAAYLGAGKRAEIRRFVQGEADQSGDAPQEAPVEAKRAANNAERRIARHGAVAAREAAKSLAGTDKSTVMRALTGSAVLVANKLFATLDTTVRALVPEGVPRVLVSDTVGFIKNLPHDLVASFKSTLEEAAEASLLLHMIDASDPGFERQIEVAEKVLEEIEAGKVPRLRVFNKIDQVGDAKAQKERAKALRAQFPKCLVMSAVDKDDVAKLQKAIRAFFGRHLVKAELFLPWSAQPLRGELFAVCQVLEERADTEGTHFSVRGERKAIEDLRERIKSSPHIVD